LIHQELSEAITGAAMKVLNTLRPGLDEILPLIFICVIRVIRG
jgi:hypothetical protein